MKNVLNYGAIAFMTLIVTTVSVLAQSPFGDTGERWTIGAKLEKKGDFDSAIIQYQRALQAIKTIGDSHLRECATIGTIARLEGATTGKRYLQTHGKGANSLIAAQAASDERFRQVIDEFDTKRPDLANSCP